MLIRVAIEWLRFCWRHRPRLVACNECGGSFWDWFENEVVRFCSLGCESARYSWLCRCGNWQDDGLHCDHCGKEPPWGCDCGMCNDPAEELEEDYYPGPWDE
jgi:hypothetical protein